MIDSYGVPGAFLNCPVVENQFNTRVVILTLFFIYIDSWGIMGYLPGNVQAL